MIISSNTHFSVVAPETKNILIAKKCGSENKSRNSSLIMCINSASPVWTRVRHWSAPTETTNLTEDKLVDPILPWEYPLGCKEEELLLTSGGKSESATTATRFQDGGEKDCDQPKRPMGINFASLVLTRVRHWSAPTETTNLTEDKLVDLILPWEYPLGCEKEDLLLNSGVKSESAATTATRIHNVERDSDQPNRQENAEVVQVKNDSRNSESINALVQHGNKSSYFHLNPKRLYHKGSNHRKKFLTTETENVKSSSVIAETLTPATAAVSVPEFHNCTSFFSPNPLSGLESTYRLLSKPPDSFSSSSSGQSSEHLSNPCNSNLPLKSSPGAESTLSLSQFVTNSQQECSFSNGRRWRSELGPTPSPSSTSVPELNPLIALDSRDGSKVGLRTTQQKQQKHQCECRNSIVKGNYLNSAEHSSYPKSNLNCCSVWSEEMSCSRGTTSSTATTTTKRPHGTILKLKFPVKKLSVFWSSFWIALLLSFAGVVEAKICQSMVFKSVESMKDLKGCTVVEGSIMLSLGILDKSYQIPSSDTVPDLNITFPDLKEITDYLIVYQSKNIPRLTNMFPNLTVIRGDKLLEDWALIIYSNDDLEEIGLTGLTKILRGAVRIARNKKLCYANTINWEEITQREFYEKNVIKDNQAVNTCPELCPAHCPPLKNQRTSCWNENTCQRVQIECPNPHKDNRVCYRENGSNPSVSICDKECLGGCNGTNQEMCFSCKNVFFSDKSFQRCQDVCPPPLLKYKNWRCVDRDECRSKSIYVAGENIVEEIRYKIYKGQCLEHCPKNTKDAMDEDGMTPICVECIDCPRKCTGTVISSLNVLTNYESCTHIQGDLTIQMSGSNVVQHLTKYLSQIKEITGFLKISRTYALVSLDFFSSLEVIRGRRSSEEDADDYSSLKIQNNENLAKLFPDRDGKTVQILTTDQDGNEERGRAFIHYNARLCKSTIKNLLHRSNMIDPGDNSADISYATNGNKAICSSIVLNIVDILLSARLTYIQFDNYQETMTKNWPQSTLRTLLGYEIHYREVSDITFKTKNLTKYDGRDACGTDDWTVLDHTPSPEEIGADGSPIWPVETAILSVKPFTYYAVFISTLLLKEYTGSQGVEGAESDIHYFQTPEDIPGLPESVEVIKVNYSSINITWAPPSVPNGIIDHYEVVLEFNEINPARILGSRPYCNEAYRIVSTPERPEQPTKVNRTIPNVVPLGETCSCENCGKEPTQKVSSHQDKVEEELFHDAIINVLFDDTHSLSFPDIRSKRAIKFISSDNDLEAVKDKNKKAENKGDDEIILEDNYKRVRVINDSPKYGPPSPSYNIPHKRKKLINKKPAYYLTYSARVNGTVRSLHIPDLKHYGSYTLKIRACQAVFGSNQTTSLEKFCSKDVVKEVRVLHKPKADDILSDITPSSKNDTENVWISWEPPADPNSIIVNYNIRSKAKADPSADYVRGCITAKEFVDNGFKYELTMRGSYYVSVQAVSVYGPGRWTEDQWVTIPEQSETLLYVLIPILIVIFLVIIFMVFFYVKRNQKENTMIATDNCGYISVKELYQADDWEVDRNHITILEELGRGGFGRVHRGIYAHPTKGNIDIAIKTVQENARHRDCIQFLVEAHTMKSFDTPHVVKLLGVVVRCQPHLVILELMAVGDLKNYLRRLRPDDPENTEGKPPPTVLEVKQMALEIVDGMSYLSTHHKHIVHRDLAARNCMVSADLVVKIGDFGMAREIYTTDYYRKGDKGYMPVRWMAPESLKDGVFTSASDVWSFGIVLWEMVTLAQLPYYGYTNTQVVENVIKGRIMERPEDCPDELWQLMVECWNKRPNQRPTFLDLCQRLLPIANERFRNNSFIFSEAGGEAIQHQEEERRLIQEEEIAAKEEHEQETTPCLTGNGNSNSNGEAHVPHPTPVISTTDNGHVQMTEFGGTRPVSTTTNNSSSRTIPSVRFINDVPSTGSKLANLKWPMNGLKKLRHKSGSTSGEA